VTFIGVTGSCGKTSTTAMIAALLGTERRGTSSPGDNRFTDVGKTVLRTGSRHSFCVVEIAAWGPGTVARAARVVAPDVAVITNIGPAHLRALRTLAGVATAKAEMISATRAGGTVVVPAGERLLSPHLRSDLRILSFGEGGDVRLLRSHAGIAEIDLAGRRIVLEVAFDQRHLLRDLLAAVAAAFAAGLTPAGTVPFSPLPGRGRRVSLGRNVTLIDDAYNANPMSVRAALDDLVSVAERYGHSRRIAVLGDMLELGPSSRWLHEEIGEHADRCGVDVLVTVGAHARALSARFSRRVVPFGRAAEAVAAVPRFVEPGDVVLVKGSRAIGLERVCEALCAARIPPVWPVTDRTPGGDRGR
jgi:UDP-N-acetylmuramoyl-tripeptide--D-alanyl-D-alanine ligase